MHDNIRLIRNIFFKTFLISLILIYLLFGVYYGARSYWESLIVGRMALIDQHSLNVVMVSFFTLSKFYLLFMLLAPALALHWTLTSFKR